jgi:hypothetical protein
MHTYIRVQMEVGDYFCINVSVHALKQLCLTDRDGWRRRREGWCLILAIVNIASRCDKHANP